MIRKFTISGLILLLILITTACAPSSLASTPPAQSASSTASISPTSRSEPTDNTIPSPTVTKNIIPITGHLMRPAAAAPGTLIRDVESSGTAAPYGDSYKINRFERPFLSDMTYVSDIDIVTFSLSQDADWYYISIELSGNNPNNSIGINYGVEIDLNADGFGDYLIWAHPPYITPWDARNVQVFKDSDHDSGGLSSRQSDAVFDGNGYDTLVYDGGTKQNADPDSAWVRMNGGEHANIQFAFKKSLTNSSSFMMGVIADAGLKDVFKFDYNDRLKEADAGSPVRINKNYPLGLLYAVDSTCWQAYGIQPKNYEPKFCPTVVSATATNKSPANLLSTNTVLPPTSTSTPTTTPPTPTPTTLPTPTPTEPPAEPTATPTEPLAEPTATPTEPPPEPTATPPEPTPSGCYPVPPCEYDPVTCACL